MTVGCKPCCLLNLNGYLQETRLSALYFALAHHNFYQNTIYIADTAGPFYEIYLCPENFMS